jgi:hypothetical protein
MDDASTRRLTGKSEAPAAGSTADAVRRLEALRPRIEALVAERIRADSEVERLERDEGNARSAARDAFGTDDPQAIGAMIDADRAREAEAIADLEATLAAIEARLAAAAAGE